MKLFRFRFIILGLLLCIFHVWCRTCGTVFTDPASSTYLADVVIEGTVYQKLVRYGSDLYKIRVNVRKVRKGEIHLPNGKQTKTLFIGYFSDSNVSSINSKENCIPSINVEAKQKYFFFIKNSTDDYVNTAFPVKVTKATNRAVRKLSCRKCDKAPTLKTIKVRKKYVEGKKIQISCRIRTSRPAPEMVWERNGKVLQTKKNGFVIKKTRRGIVLRKRKAKLSDSGTYVCEAKNVVGKTRQEVKIEVKPAKKKPTKPKPNKPKKTTTTTPAQEVTDVSPTLFYKCPAEYQGKCFNGGTCEIIADLGVPRCRCPATHTGDRCEYRKMIFARKAQRNELEKDRTLTIIGIVIGILIFVCICIASYLLAKRRRNQFFRRQAEKRQQLEQKKHIPPSYSKLPSIDEVSELSKFKLYERVTMNHRETQTDETSFISPNPHTNLNLYLNPMENEPVLRHTEARRNSRSRLSGVSDGRRSQPLSEPTENRQSSNNHRNSKEIKRDVASLVKNEVTPKPKIPKFSEADQSSDEEQNDKMLPSLHISDDQLNTLPLRTQKSNPPSYANLNLEENSPLVRNNKTNSLDLELDEKSSTPFRRSKKSNTPSTDLSMEDHSGAPLIKLEKQIQPSIHYALDDSPKREIMNGFTDDSSDRLNSYNGKVNPAIVYTPTSNSDNTSEISSSSECSTWSKEEQKNKMRTSEPNIQNDSGYAWNEHGSPEVVRKTHNRRRSASDARKTSLTNQNELYSQLATSGADFRIYDLRDDDIPSIPV